MVEGFLEAFCYLQRAPRLVLADSTFSWWAAFLGNATEVHFPSGNLSNIMTQWMVVDDEPRYVYRNHSGHVIIPE